MAGEISLRRVYHVYRCGVVQWPGMKKIVTIGGGTGSYTLLSGLRDYPFDLTAVVSMADDGGSTGFLRDELGVLPPGDVRQCLVALSDAPETMRALMNYRFTDGDGLRGHNFGNLLLSALEKITGSFAGAVAEASRILGVRGRVVPVSGGDMRLVITLENGTVVEGERQLDENPEVRSVGVHSVALARPVRATAAAVAAIRAADIIVIGPGDHFGSILPNLFVGGVARAIKSTAASVVFVAPLTNKRGHREHFSVGDYVDALEVHIGHGRIDTVVANTRVPSAAMVAQYEAMEGRDSLVRLDADDMARRTYAIVRGDFLRTRMPGRAKGDMAAATRSFIRHDSAKLARAIALVAEQGEDEIEIIERQQ